MKSLPLALSLALAVGLASNASAAAVFTALWQFEETSGTTATDTVASLPSGLFSGANLNATGKFGSGIDFSADVTQAARMTTSTAAGHAATQQIGDFSILTWIRPTAGDLTNNFNRFIDTSHTTGAITSGYRLMTGGTGATDQFRFLGDSGANTDITHTRALLADTWALLAVRYDTDGQATVNVLLDTDTVSAGFVGTNGESVGANGPINYNAGENTNFGSMDSPTINNNEFEGRMDDAAFFSSLLTDAEIATAFNSGASALIPEPSVVVPLGLVGFGLLFRRRR